MNSCQQNFNFEFAALAGFYNMAYAGLSSFGMIFLLSKGLNDSDAGLALSFVALASAFLQPWLAEKIDADRKRTIFDYNHYFVLITILVIIKMLAFPINSTSSIIDFILVYILVWTITPLLNGIFSFLKIQGLTINYGFGRSFGSLATAASSLFLSFLISKNLIYVILYTLLSMILYEGMIIYSEKKYNRLQLSQKTFVPSKTSKGLLISFIKSNRSFLLFLIGTILLLTFHYIVNCFMYQIMLSVGGNEQHVGIALSIGAFVTIPVISLYENMQKIITNSQALILSAIFFVLKAVLLLTSNHVYTIYLAELLQSFSYGLYSAASVYIVTEKIENAYQNIGQSLVTSAATIGGVVGPALGGMIIERFSTTALLVTCLCLTGLGLLAYIFALKPNQTLHHSKSSASS